MESGDFVVLSSTPSFDPRVGMDDPGNPEHYQVLPNAYKGEGGTYVEGRGRVYFRIGVKGKNTGTTPRYARVKIERYGGRWGTGDNQVWYSAEYLYVRQGEEPDYIMRPGTADPISKGPLQGKSRDYARKISPYNLTSPAYYNGSNALYTPVDHKQAKFVKYPSQAGAFFQWGLPKKANQDYFRLAYHPTALTVDHWIKDIQFLNETYKLFYRYGERLLHHRKLYMIMDTQRFLNLVLKDITARRMGILIESLITDRIPIIWIRMAIMSLLIPIKMS